MSAYQLPEASKWEQAATELLEHGVSTVLLDDIDAAKMVQTTFLEASKAMKEFASRETLAATDANAVDSAHVTGYHGVGAFSGRYNQYRQGFVFSDGQAIDGLPDAMATAVQQLEEYLFAIADCALVALAKALQLPDNNWFQHNMGPFGSHSQWHLKQFVVPLSADVPAYSTPPTTMPTVQTHQHDHHHLLPSHTDPSIVSVVIHDRPGVQPGGQGLHYQSTTQSISKNKKKEWIPVPRSGHQVAVLLTGSVLSAMTAGEIPACNHAVFCEPQDELVPYHRMTATLFVRPAPTARLHMPSSHSSCLLTTPSIRF